MSNNKTKNATAVAKKRPRRYSEQFKERAVNYTIQKMLEGVPPTHVLHQDLPDKPGMPSEGRLFEWLTNWRDDITEAYSRAREALADHWFYSGFNVIAQLREDRKMWQSYQAEFNMISRLIGQISPRYNERAPLVNIDNSKHETNTTTTTTTNVLMLGQADASVASRIRRMMYRETTDVPQIPANL